MIGAICSEVVDKLSLSWPGLETEALIETEVGALIR